MKVPTAQPNVGYHGYPRAIHVEMAQHIPGYSGYPPPRVGVDPQGYKYTQLDFNR